MRILITGGAGYVGSVLVPHLLNAGHEVVVYDALWFGCHIPNHPNLRVIQGDIRNIGWLKYQYQLHNINAVIHLACIANDPSVELDAEATKTINLDAFEPLVIAAKEAGVHRFIYCSTSSVYGISDAPEVTEDHPLVPITLYNRYKGECEPILFEHASDDFTCTILRPATVCGYSPRQRLDLCVNILTNHAVNKGVITVFGGNQIRPNIHIKDLVDVYNLLLTAPHDKIHKEIFNVQCEYHTITDLAQLVKTVVDEECYNGEDYVKIVTTPSNDLRSYRINADKIKQVLNYEPKLTIADAVSDLIRAFRNHLLPNSLDDPRYYNVETMKKLGMSTTPRSDPGYGTPAGAAL
jgi:nucleoside-diphosphate-sugar epimerase